MSRRILVKVYCLECQKQFQVSPNASPECPRCGGTDIHVREDFTVTMTCVDCRGPIPTPTPDPFRCPTCRVGGFQVGGAR